MTDHHDDPVLTALIAEARACTVCAAQLPFPPRPVLRVASTASLLIVSQAPSTKVHQTGIPWNDASGDRLRQWLGLEKARFYDQQRVAILPVGLCYPGTDRNGGDRPPRPECAPLWHPRLRPLLVKVRLTLLIGSYAQAWYLGPRRQPTLTATVAAWADYLPDYLPLPHPSWRNTGWLKRHPWFETDLVPELRRRVGELVG